jgi:hypothetical protein
VRFEDLLDGARVEARVVAGTAALLVEGRAGLWGQEADGSFQKAGAVPLLGAFFVEHLLVREQDRSPGHQGLVAAEGLLGHQPGHAVVFRQVLFLDSSRGVFDEVAVLALVDEFFDFLELFELVWPSHGYNTAAVGGAEVREDAVVLILGADVGVPPALDWRNVRLRCRIVRVHYSLLDLVIGEAVVNVGWRWRSSMLLAALGPRQRREQPKEEDARERQPRHGRC